MEEDKVLTDEVIAAPTAGSGSLLAAARKQQQKTVEEIATELNLSVTQIKSIELDQTEGLPEPTYVRGYIRGYAKLLGLNPEEVLKSYLNAGAGYSSNLSDIPGGISSAEHSRSSFLRTSNIFAILLLLGLLVVAWYMGMLDGLLGAGQQRAASSGAQTTIAANRDDSSSDAAESPVISPDELAAVAADVTADQQTGEELLAGEEVSQEAAEQVPTESVESDARESVADAGLNRLQIDFSQTSWVDIRDEQDNRLAYKSYAAGEQLEVESESSLRVFIGNADGVSVALNGEPFAIESYREGVYAKFVAGD